VKRAVLVAASAVLLAVFGVAAWRELGAGSRGLDACDRAVERKEWGAAIAGARTAAEATLPGSPYPQRGYARLEAIARDAEARGDDDTAAEAWRAMRAAALSTSGVGVRAGDRRALADEGLLRVSRARDAASTAGGRHDEVAEEAALAAALARDEAPPTFTLILLAVGGVAFFAGLFRLAWVAGESLSLRRLRLPIVAAVLGAAAYAFAVLRG
jgi:hypothetical protein